MSSKYEKSFQKLLKKPCFTTKEAEKSGIPRYILSDLCKEGKLERLFRGVYQLRAHDSNIDLQWEELVFTAKSIPNGIICLISALAYYDLTDEMLYENWIAIPHRMRAPCRPRTRIYRMRNTKLGVENIRLGDYSLKIFDRERCIIDAFRFLDLEVALKALRAYLENNPNLKKLSKYEKKFKVNISPYLYAYSA